MTINVSVGTAFQAQVPSLLVLGGANITVSTTSGSFTIIGRDVPVSSVQGKTGAIVLTRADLTAAAATHTHSFSDIVGFTSASNVVSVAGRTGVVTLSASDVKNLTSVANVVSVAGRTGAVTLGASDVTNLTSVANVVSVNGRTGVVTLGASDVTNLTSVANVVSVAGRTGVVTLSAADVSGLSLVATSGSAGDLTGTLSNSRLSSSVVILNSSGQVPAAYLPSYVDDVVEYASTSAFPAAGETGKIYTALNTGKIYRWSGSTYTEISPSPGSTDSVTEGSVNLYYTNARAAAAAPVQSVNGRVGTVSLSFSDVSAASSTHAHNYVQSLNALTGTPSIVAGSNVTVTTGANSITIAAGGGGGIGNVISVNGQTGTVVLASSDISAASSTHAHNYVQSLNGQTGSVSVVAGSNISLSTAAGSITISGSTAQSLVIGTVVDGTAAAATITGSPPALNLTLPAGTFGTPQEINAQTGDYTLVLADAGKLITVNTGTSPVTITIPTNASVAFPIGTHIDIARIASGSFTIAAASGATVQGTPGTRLRANYSTGTLIKISTNWWLLVGDLST